MCLLRFSLDYYTRFKNNAYLWGDTQDKGIMRCYYHPHKHAVAQCVDCHKGLCYRCANRYQIPICKECNRKRKSENVVHYMTPLVICMVLFAIGLSLNFMGAEPIMSGYVLMSIFGGWKALNQFLPTILVWINPSSIWLIGFSGAWLSRIFMYIFKSCLRVKFY